MAESIVPSVYEVIPPLGPVSDDGVVPLSQFKPFDEVPTRKDVPSTDELPFTHPSVVYAAEGDQSALCPVAAVCVLKSYIVLIQFEPPAGAVCEDIEAIDASAIPLIEFAAVKAFPDIELIVPIYASSIQSCDGLKKIIFVANW